VEDAACAWVQAWGSCKESCDGKTEDRCWDQCSWNYDDEICETACEYSDDDGCWFEGGSYDIDEDHLDCFSEGLCIPPASRGEFEPPQNVVVARG